MVANKKIIHANNVSEYFGLNSKIFNLLFNFLKVQKELQTSEFQKRFNVWNSIFRKVYGTESSEELFLKHSYMVILLKTILSIKLEDQFRNINLVRRDRLSEDVFNPEIEFFFCPKISDEIHNEIFNLLSGSDYAKEDLFQGLYQQVFLILTRHKLGEYYTPRKLVEMMIKDVYKVGFKILDPSCGSGSFLIETINIIMKSNISETLKIEAIENLYAFDINPLATLTAKVNVILLVENFLSKFNSYPNLHIYHLDGLFPEKYRNKVDIDIKSLYSTFDLIIGNPPWLTYKDLIDKDYQLALRTLSEELKIKPQSQYITHIEMGAIFFYASAKAFLKINGIIFFVITKSVLNGDHCFKFRSFRIFHNLEIWDFPDNQFFNIQHICLKGKYIGEDTSLSIQDKYPIITKIIDNNFKISEITEYSSIKIEEFGAKIILPINELAIISSLSESPYMKQFFQGATLVPKPLIFFKIDQQEGTTLTISSDPEILKRAKKKWYLKFYNEKIESKFAFKTFLNKDIVPFYIKQFRNVFLPVNSNLEYNLDYLNNYPLGSKFYKKMDDFYKKHKKTTSKISTLFSNLNYWNKLTKQNHFKSFNVVYNASGSNLKAVIVDNTESYNIISSENYYYSTDSLNEAAYLSAILNSPILSRYIKLIKSSRHIHKRPFSFPIPKFNKENPLHDKLAKKGLKYHTVVQDLVVNNPKISPEKVRIFIHQKLSKLNSITKELVFNI